MSKPESKKPLLVIVAVIAALVLCYVLTSLYLDRYPWIFGGSGTPDIVNLTDGYRLEKVIALRRGYFIKDIRGGRMIYGRGASGQTGEINGAADLDGNVIVPLGAHDGDLWLAFDENGEVYETGEPYTAEEAADKPSASIETGGGRTALCYDVNGYRLVSYGGALGMTDNDGSVSTLLDAGNGKGWRLEDPSFFGEYVVVRIYWCDCVYRIVKDQGR